MVAALVTGAAAGLGIGYVLQRGQLCLLSMFASALARRTLLPHGWLLGVAVASVGLSLPGPSTCPGPGRDPRRGDRRAAAGTVGPVPGPGGGTLWRWPTAERPAEPWQRTAPRLGVALGLGTIAGWVLAKAGGSRFGPSTVGASASVASGSPNWWLIAFLLAIAGAAIAARTAGGWQLRAETPVRYARLAAGGFLLGAGGWIAGGCNLGHGLSGAALLCRTGRGTCLGPGRTMRECVLFASGAA
jgi:uncharacterized protein